MAEIRLDRIDKVYPGGTHAVHGVDLHIADGEFMIMVGPSGCAKSTILRMIAGLEVPTGGTVTIGNRVVNDVAPKDRDIAMVFQSYALYPHMTVRDNMAFGLRLRKMPDQEINARVAEAARILGLEHLLDRLPKAMSGGQRQRVAMGRAIVREPQAFLMDEPLSNLDAKLRVQMRTEIAKLHQRLGTTTVYVTHDQVEAMTLGQRICILRKGYVQQVDTPHEVYRNPANIFVGGFIGSPGMNFLSGRVVPGQDGAVWLRLGEQYMPLPASVTGRMVEGIVERDVVVGIRPEHVALGSAGEPTSLPVRVDLVEVMGAEQYAYVTSDVPAPDLSALSDTQAASETFVARLDADQRISGGSTVDLRLDLGEVHLFDPVSQLTILAPVHADAQGHSVVTPSVVAQAPAPQLVVPQGPSSTPGFAHTYAPARVGATIDMDHAAVASIFDQPLASPVPLSPIETIPAAAPLAMPVAMGMGPDAHVVDPASITGAVAAGTARPSAVATWSTGQPPVDGGSVTIEPPAPAAPKQSGGFAPRRIRAAATPAAPQAAPAPTATPVVPGTNADASLPPVEDAQLSDAIQQLTEAAANPSPFRSALASIRGTGPAVPRPGISVRALRPSLSTDMPQQVQLGDRSASEADPGS